MLKVEIANGKATILEGNGTPEQIASAVIVAIRELYEMFCGADPESGYEFYCAVHCAVADPLAPLWVLEEDNGAS